MDTPLDLHTRLTQALDAATQGDPNLRAEYEALFAQAHAEASEVIAGARPASKLGDFAAAHALLTGPETRPLIAPQLDLALPVHVADDGALWGVGKYEQLDPRWAEALIHYLENLHSRVAFPTAPVVAALPADARIDVVGDWGTGFWRAGTGAEGVAARIAADTPEVAVHLGDTYYAGASDEIAGNLVGVWPRGPGRSFALNGNHEMYDGGKSFFGAALSAGGPFAAQKGCSYFALVHPQWLVLGLDTAYFATGKLYLDGAIDAGQQAFLGQMVAQFPGRRVMLLSHHEGTNLEGTTTTHLYDQVVSGLGRAPDVWYWGHAHNGVIYAPRGGSRFRCVGHGAVPYGRASALAGKAEILFSETASAHDAATPERVKNGYVRVSLGAGGAREELVAEDGSVRYAAAL